MGNNQNFQEDDKAVQNALSLLGKPRWRKKALAALAAGLAEAESAADAALEDEFQRLAALWAEETQNLSSVQEIALHPAYQQIIGMGDQAIPWILRELQQRPNHWFWALRAITRENPVSEQEQGRVPAMINAWLKWGKDRGYLD